MNQSNTRRAGFALITIFGALLIFQLLLALGNPLTGAAWGGQYEVLPTSLRLASLVAALIFLFAILVVLEKLGLVTLLKRRKLINGILWFFRAYLLLNTVGNLASSSDVERWLFGPATAIASALTAVVALRTRRATST